MTQIYFESVAPDAVRKATPIDAYTGREASILTPVASPRVAQAQAAVRKLEFVTKRAKWRDMGLAAVREIFMPFA